MKLIRHAMKSLLRQFGLPRLKSRIVSAMKNADTSVVLNQMLMLMDHAIRQHAS
jgi:hypothetical protein